MSSGIYKRDKRKLGKGRADHLTRLKPNGDRAMSRKPVAVALPVEIDDWVRSLPNRSEWLRQAIADAYQREINSSDS